MLVGKQKQTKQYLEYSEHRDRLRIGYTTLAVSCSLIFMPIEE